MNIRMIVLACLLSTQATAGVADERYRCGRVISDNSGALHLDEAEYADLGFDGDAASVRAHIGGSSKDLVFAGCAAVKADGSNFSHWFAQECRKFGSADGGSYTAEPFLIGAYAAVSPPIGADYVLYPTLVEAGGQTGSGTPERTVVIYAERKPQYEFFCYRQAARP